MKIKNVKELTRAQMVSELKHGGKLVMFQYCVSGLVVTFKRGSAVYFIRQGESTTRHSLIYILISFLFGWWGVPWGPIHTVAAIFTNLRGGKDVTAKLLEVLDVN
ncbi:hypothetical protein COT97_00495 [Candidatus Falkowbacteria bacterium CG10_big_fil_rev_8_21_14_0_10_39_11]|uniref:Uncharacterized protein n=1 Tax=Candidatus Falkowbacteria bacterium CG10_big_fil_rev_8_21_14_0_10_39_11 TaxID=1974565 RepID=A0A2H0V675_9BACT|nr:MAG: hypothetical protein COT97_00495 [Candidatus Falkowbacteria bacterium CG10_big_fil_rev_8_21_14_0_10_39_11]